MMKSYKPLANLGHGAHSTVVEGVCIKTGEKVAIKKIINRRVRDQYYPNPLEREVKCLELIRHPNIVELRDKIVNETKIILIFELLATDLDQVLKKDKLGESVIKAYLKMILKGVSYCHSMNIIHRDLKPSNILISSNGILKIADFGLARIYEPGNDRPMSHQVATRWYRSIELLYGSKSYDTGVDMWAIGCIFGEMLNGLPLFPGQSDIEQLVCVVSILGTPDYKNWPKVVELPDYNKIIIPASRGKSLGSICPGINANALDVLSKFLIYNTKNRITADDALREMYFIDDPQPTPTRELPKYVKSSLGNKRLRKDYLDFDSDHFMELSQ